MMLKRITYYLLQYGWLVLGLFVMSNGIVLLIQANLGPAPWDVLHTGINNHLPFSLGQVMIGTGVVVVLISWALGVKPYTGTIINMFLVGCFVDLIIGWGWYPALNIVQQQLLYMFFGVILCGVGTGIYICANLGSGPRDSLMLALCKITGRRVGLVRTTIEITVVIIGFLLGGILGVGTIVFSLTIGWVVEFFLNLFQKLGRHPAFEYMQQCLVGPFERRTAEKVEKFGQDINGVSDNKAKYVRLH